MLRGEGGKKLTNKGPGQQVRGTASINMNFGSVRYGRTQERILRVAAFGVAMGARGEGTWTGTRQTVGGQVDLYLLTDKKSNPSVCCCVVCVVFSVPFPLCAVDLFCVRFGASVLVD